MKKSSFASNPVATLGACVTLFIVFLSTRHCMKKYRG